VLLGAPHEPWPRSRARPMWPLCQVLVEELPAAAPGPLADVALLTLFADLVDLPYRAPNGEGWELRTYTTTDGLVPLVEPEREVSERHPEEALEVRPFPVIWRPRVELPAHDDTPSELLDVRDELADVEERDGGLLDLDGLKVGGWPRAVQAGVDWTLPDGRRVADAQFVLQVDSDEKARLPIGDSGVAYVGWSPTEGWVLSWQCY
jgi:hypothetical protein